MKPKRLLIFLILIPIALIGWWISTFFASPKEKTETPFYKVKKGNLCITVTEKGTLEPKEVIQITPKDMFTGEAENERNPAIYDFTILRVVPNGEKIKKGDVLVEFNRSRVEELLKTAQNDQKTALDNYDQAINKIKTDKQAMEIQVERNKLDLKRTQESYNQKLSEVDSGKINPDDLAFKEIKLTLKEKKRILENSEREMKVITTILRKYENINPLEIATTVKEPSKVPAGIKGLQESALSMIYSNDGEIMVPSDWGIRMSETLNATSVKTSGNSPLTSIPEELKNERTEILNKYLKPIQDTIRNIESRNKYLEQIKKYPNPLIIYSPTQGHVFYGSAPGSHSWYTSPEQIKVGANINHQQPILYISNTVDMKTDLTVDEININKVKKGQIVKVTPDAFPDIVLSGVVTTVREVPVQRNYWEQATESKYPVSIWLNESDQRLRPKMTAKCEILCEEIKDVLFIPINAVFNKNSKNICYLLINGNPTERIVKTGKSTDDFVVIEEGLKENDQIYLYDPFLKK
jgi:multidrug efflux pump subunit AcrA (membrane-fusion protein)